MVSICHRQDEKRKRSPRRRRLPRRDRGVDAHEPSLPQLQTIQPAHPGLERIFRNSWSRYL